MNQPHMAPWWFPANDHPRDKARIGSTSPCPRATVSRTASRPAVRSTGASPRHMAATEPMAPYLAFFAAGRFTTAREDATACPGRWRSPRACPARQAGGDGADKRTPALVAWLETQLGDYPFSSTGGVTTALTVGFALENQTRPTYSSCCPGGVSIAVHELAHQWFGDSVSVARWRDIWLNEGAATFMEVATGRPRVTWPGDVAVGAVRRTAPATASGTTGPPSRAPATRTASAASSRRASTNAAR